MHVIIGIDPHKASHTAVAISDREDQLGLFKIPKGLGHEQHGVRYGIVVQADEFLPRSVVIVAPTSRSARQASFRPLVEVEGATTVVLVEQLGAVDVGRLGKRAGRLSVEEMWSVDEALATYLGLRHL